MKIAALKTTKQEQVSAAKRAFVMSLLDISWRLASVFLVPLFIGIVAGNPTAGMIAGFVCATLFIIKLGIDSSKATQ